jgi:hypothetical protein
LTSLGAVTSVVHSITGVVANRDIDMQIARGGCHALNSHTDFRNAYGGAGYDQNRKIESGLQPTRMFLEQIHDKERCRYISPVGAHPEDVQYFWSFQSMNSL